MYMYKPSRYQFTFNPLVSKWVFVVLYVSCYIFWTITASRSVVVQRRDYLMSKGHVVTCHQHTRDTQNVPHAHPTCWISQWLYSVWISSTASVAHSIVNSKLQGSSAPHGIWHTVEEIEPEHLGWYTDLELLMLHGFILMPQLQSGWW